ncbi:MAG: DUF4421 domain-containing protein [Chlorobi bacterium]|nr:DUF4421 domain-containing protein [Chlorobiota bacterium]
MKSINIYIIIVILVWMNSISSSLKGQVLDKSILGHPDSNYIESFADQLTMRLYTSRKFTNFTLSDDEVKPSLEYRPNDRLNLGIGATYYGLSLNIGLNFPFVNNDDSLFGQTSYLDLQSHLLMRKFTFELWFSYYQGYYIGNPQKTIPGWDIADNYPQRGDINSIVGGVSGYYIFNYNKFSYRAAFIQDEWQKKSAGSFLVGGALYAVDVQADSSFIPYDIYDTLFFAGTDFKRSFFTTISANGGYAHSFIIKKKVFFTLSLLGGIGVGNSKIETTDGNQKNKHHRQDDNERELHFQDCSWVQQ